MSGDGSAFGEAAPGVRTASSESEGDILYTYTGTLTDRPETVRILTVAPTIDEKAALDAFSKAAAKWDNTTPHQNIVPVYARDKTPRPWVAIADITGQPLDVAQSSLSPGEIQTVIGDVAEALRIALLYNTYHQNLTPDQIWVVPGNGGVTGRIDMWGVEAAVRTTIAQPKITPFTAPEMVTDPTAGGEAVDVYGLGAITYFALTGQSPVATETDIASAITDGEVLPPSEHNSSVSSAVDEIVLEALATEPTARPESAYAFAQAFQRAFEVPDDATAGASGVTPPLEEESEPQRQKAQAKSDSKINDGQSPTRRRTMAAVLGIGVLGAGSGWAYSQMNKEANGASETPTGDPLDDTPTEDTTTEDAPVNRSSAEPTDQPEPAAGQRFSFEDANPGAGQLPSPWTIIQDPTSEGFKSVEISEQRATHETQTLHMSGNGQLDRILVGFRADLSEIGTARCDIYIERANVSAGEIFFGMWDGESTKIIAFLGQTGGEGQSRFNETGEFLNVEGDLSEFSGEHQILFNVRGDNEAYFDNLRLTQSL